MPVFIYVRTQRNWLLQIRSSTYLGTYVWPKLLLLKPIYYYNTVVRRHWAWLSLSLTCQNNWTIYFLCVLWMDIIMKYFALWVFVNDIIFLFCGCLVWSEQERSKGHYLDLNTRARIIPLEIIEVFLPYVRNNYFMWSIRMNTIKHDQSVCRPGRRWQNYPLQKTGSPEAKDTFFYPEYMA